MTTIESISFHMFIIMGCQESVETNLTNRILQRVRDLILRESLRSRPPFVETSHSWQLLVHSAGCSAQTTVYSWKPVTRPSDDHEEGNGRMYLFSILGSIEKNKLYRVHMYVKSNTGTNADGHVQIKINGTTLIDQSIRWTINDSKRLINNLSFHT